MKKMALLIKKLSQTPLNLNVEPTKDPLISRFSFSSLHDDTIFGHIFESKKPSKHTWIVLYHGLGAHTQTAGYLAFVSWWNKEGYDVIGIDIRHQGGLSRGTPIPDTKGLYVSGINNFESYYYTCVYADVFRLIDVASHIKPHHHIYVTGGSQGGALALCAAALHRKVELVMVEMPSNTDIKVLINQSEGGFKSFITHHIKTPSWLIDEIDILNYAHAIRVPTLIGSGTNDQICPYETSISLFASLKCMKNFVTYEGYGHGGYDERFFEEKLKFIQAFKKDVSSNDY